MRQPHLLVVAGDPSADEHAAGLVRSLRQRLPGLRVTALGGNHLKNVSDHFLYPLVGVGGFGFLEPILKIPELWRVRRSIDRLLQTDTPNVVLPCDYYGFNIHVAEAAHRRKVPVIYFISPQVWASRPGRIQRLGKVIKKMLVIFPFEEKLYRDAGVDAVYVGHPLVDRLPTPADPGPTVRIGLLPGSRKGVALRHLPLLAETADRLHARYPETELILFRAQNLDAALFEPWTQSRPWIRLEVDGSLELRRTLSLAIGVSGTAALENTLLGIPMVIMYRLSTVTYQIAKRLIRIPFVGIPNILAGRSIVPELLQDDATPDKLAAEAAAILHDEPRRRRMREELLALRGTLQTGATDRAAEEIIRFLAHPTS
jgi:lipid-A-disaccharide synthase